MQDDNPWSCKGTGPVKSPRLVNSGRAGGQTLLNLDFLDGQEVLEGNVGTWQDN